MVRCQRHDRGRPCRATCRPLRLGGRMSASLIGSLRSAGDTGLNTLGHDADCLTLRPWPAGGRFRAHVWYQISWPGPKGDAAPGEVVVVDGDLVHLGADLGVQVVAVSRPRRPRRSSCPGIHEGYKPDRCRRRHPYSQRWSCTDGTGTPASVRLGVNFGPRVQCGHVRRRHVRRGHVRYVVRDRHRLRRYIRHSREVSRTVSTGSAGSEDRRRETRDGEA